MNNYVNRISFTPFLNKTAVYLCLIVPLDEAPAFFFYSLCVAANFWKRIMLKQEVIISEFLIVQINEFWYVLTDCSKLSDENQLLRLNIQRQISLPASLSLLFLQYYFGNHNLPRDKFLKEQIKLDDGWVPLEVMIKFNR